jgi:hypothetical protein
MLRCGRRGLLQIHDLDQSRRLFGRPGGNCADRCQCSDQSADDDQRRTECERTRSGGRVDRTSPRLGSHCRQRRGGIARSVTRPIRELHRLQRHRARSQNPSPTILRVSRIIIAAQDVQHLIAISLRRALFAGYLARNRGAFARSGERARAWVQNREIRRAEHERATTGPSGKSGGGHRHPVPLPELVPGLSSNATLMAENTPSAAWIGAPAPEHACFRDLKGACNAGALPPDLFNSRQRPSSRV